MGGHARAVNQRILLSNGAPKGLNFLQPPRILQRRSVTSQFSNQHTTIAASSCFRLRINASLSSSVPNPNHGLITGRFLSLSSSESSYRPSNNSFFSCNSNPLSWSSSWSLASDTHNDHGQTLLGPKSSDVTVVLLGWLGGKRKHLKRYAALYNALGMNAFMFTTEVRDFMSLDLKKNVEKRMSALEQELFSWISEGNNTQDRSLIFHTFSNTGLFVYETITPYSKTLSFPTIPLKIHSYGNILHLMRNRNSPRLEDKIRGTIIDSGGGGLLDPKVWAAGWSTALLKKRSSTTQSEFVRENEAKQQSFFETFLLGATEKFFSSFLSLPEMERKMDEIISEINNPPLSPQLFLYSTADKVVPFDLIEDMVQKQMQHGRKVSSFNFVSSPHVDHYRNFPDTYSRLISSFLEDCFAIVRKL